MGGLPIKAGKFPKGIKINGLRKWWESVVLAYINSEDWQTTHIETDPTEPPLSVARAPTPKPLRKRLDKHVKLSKKLLAKKK